MAREQRKDVDYFPHDCTHGRKMHIIESKYGNDGYATWFKLLEQLGKANNHYIDISDDMNLMFLTSIFKIDEEKTIKILNDLAKLDAIDKFLFDEYKVIYSHKFIESIQDAYRNRKGGIIQYSVLLDEIRQKNGQSSVRLTPNEPNLTEVIPKVNKSKVNKSKVEEIKEKEIKESIVVSEELKIPQPCAKIDFIKFQNFFNENRGMFPEIKKMSDARKKRISVLEKQYGKDLILVAIEKAKNSPFLQGQNPTNWIASFDWIFTPANFLKIIEDNYAKRTKTSERTNAEIFNSAITSETGKNFRFGKGDN